MRMLETLIVLLALSACASNEELLRRDRMACIERGLSLDSEEFRKCMQELQLARVRRHQY